MPQWDASSLLVSLATTAITWRATGFWRPPRATACTSTLRRWPSQRTTTGRCLSTMSLYRLHSGGKVISHIIHRQQRVFEDTWCSSLQALLLLLSHAHTCDCPLNHTQSHSHVWPRLMLLFEGIWFHRRGFKRNICSYVLVPMEQIEGGGGGYIYCSMNSNNQIIIISHKWSEWLGTPFETVKGQIELYFMSNAHHVQGQSQLMDF